MADKKISQLSVASTPLAGTEVLPIVQSGATVQVSVANLTAARTVAAAALTVDANSVSDAVRITQTGAGNALVVEDSANPDASPFVINASGNVGIGTTAPDALLTVNTVASFGAGAVALPSIAAKGDLDTGIWFPAVNTIAISTAASERFRITSTGNVGIGTSAADAALTVNTVASFGAGAAALPSIAAKGDLNTGMWFPAADTIAASTGGSERMRINSSGNVGIGTTAPGNTLDIVSAGSSQIRVKDGINATAYYDFGRDGTDGFFGFSGAQTSFSGYKWSVNAGTELVRITNGGNVGIGTSSPSASAILDAQSTTKGVRFPNMTTTEKNAIASPGGGLVVFDTTLAKLCVYTGAAWQTVTSI
jgi:hypothetical protein